MRLFYLALASFLLLGCDLRDGFWPADIFMDDVEVARQACGKRDWPLAERVLERYLREEQDAEKRWQAWNLYLEALNGGSQEPRAGLDCLEVMLVEYEENEEKLASILSRMGTYSALLGRYDAAANAWSAYSDLADLRDDERVNGLRQLAAAQLRQRHFDAAEETLQQCMALPVMEKEKIWCMLDLADTGMSRERWPEVADVCQQILESEPDRMVAGLAGYLRGDALEQMGQLQAALGQFEQARDSYPNPAVIDNRIAWLKRTIKEKGK